MHGDDCYTRLASAIVMQAVKDYRSSKKKLSKGRVNHSASDMKEQCEHFFLSGWFETLSGLDGKMILDKLEKEEIR